MNSLALDLFCKQHFFQGRKWIPGRLQASLALLERLREFPVLQLEAHLAESGQSLEGHEKYGNSVLTRFALEALNKNHGRRSSNLRAWGQGLLELLADEDFVVADSTGQAAIIESMQRHISEKLRTITDREPLSVRIKNRTAESVIADILNQADIKGKAAEVSQYLVGAKLLLKFPHKASQIAVLGSNKGDRKSWMDDKARRGDFDLGELIFEVTTAAPDAKHLDQVAHALEDRDVEMWLLVRAKRQQFWLEELIEANIDRDRVTVTSIELFVAQNITELGELSMAGKIEKLQQLFQIYNETWVAAVGSDGIRIVAKDINRS